VVVKPIERNVEYDYYQTLEETGQGCGLGLTCTFVGAKMWGLNEGTNGRTGRKIWGGDV